IAGHPGVRPVPAEHLHITLVFLGNRPPAEVEPISGAVRAAAAGARAARLEPVAYRETRHVGMVTLRELSLRGERANEATALAGTLMQAFAELGVYRPESRPWMPHVTVARFKTRPFLAPRPPAAPAFNTAEVVLYESRPGP